MKILYKLTKSIIPTILLTLAIGFTYAFSLFVPHITQHLNVSEQSVRFSFCLNIFFLGIGAATFGKLIEHKIKTAAVLSTTLLMLGLCLSGLGMMLKSVWMLFAGFGFLCGIAEGIGYVTPVLNNILWFGKGKHKGLVAAISIVCFGLGSTFCSYLFKCFMPFFGIEHIFFFYAALYFAMMSIGTALISKPRFVKLMNAKKTANSKFSYANLFNDGYAQKSWLYMFLNISMGLVLIGSCASILKEVSLSADMVVVVMMLCGIFNGAGRLAFPLLSDFMKKRANMLAVVLLVEIAVFIPTWFQYSMVVFTVVVCNATYGSFFALLPSVLSDHYGNKDLSIRHSAILSAWGFASLFAYACTLAINSFCNGYFFMTILLPIVYAVNLAVVRRLDK